jgi:hypothetical protein
MLNQTHFHSEAPSASGSALPSGGARCACEQQTLGAVPWILAAAVVLLGLNWLNRKRRQKPRPDAESAT